MMISQLPFVQFEQVEKGERKRGFQISQENPQCEQTIKL